MHFQPISHESPLYSVTYKHTSGFVGIFSSDSFAGRFGDAPPITLLAGLLLEQRKNVGLRWRRSPSFALSTCASAASASGSQKVIAMA